MNTIIIPTSQNIELEYPVANPTDRLLSGLIDLAIVVGYSWIWYSILDSYRSYDDLGGYAGDVMYQLALLPAMTYSLWAEIWFQGQTLGKKLLNLRTIRLDGASPGISEYGLRWLLKLIDVWMTAAILLPGLTGMITLLVGKKGQRLGDLAAGTSVVKLRLVTAFSDTIFVETEEDYRVSFPEVASLSDRDISILKEVMDAGNKHQNETLLLRLSVKVKEVTGIETDMASGPFLTTVLKDYNFLFRD